MATVALPAGSIPGPRALPLLGPRLGLLKLFRQPLTNLRTLHRTYGDLVALAQGDPSFVIAFGPELNHRLLASPDLFQVGRSSLLKLPEESAFSRLFLSNLQTMNGAHHKQQRRLLQPAFHKQHLALYRDDMVALTEQMLARWQPGATIELSQALKQLTQRIAVKTLFGVHDEADLDRLGGMIRTVASATTSPLLLLATVDLPGSPYRRLVRMAEQMEAYMNGLIARKRAQPDASDVLATLVHVRDEDGTRLSNDELIGHAFTLFVAGHETTSNALTWTLFLLDQHPEVQAALLDELDAVLGGGAPSLEQLRPETGALPLLECVIKESLRLMPPALVGLRIAGDACELGGYALPKDANIFYSEFITQRLPELYDQPDRFIPQRWLTLERSLYEYLPFSAGPHMCIGMGFAMQELRIVLALLLQRYRLAVVPGTRIAAGVRMHPTHGLPVTIHRQDRQFRRAPVRGNVAQIVELPA